MSQHRFNLRSLPNRRLSTDTSTLNFSALSSTSASRLLRQHAQPQSSGTHSSELVPHLSDLDHVLRQKIKSITSKQNNPFNFEIHMFHPTEVANALTPASWFYSILTHS